MALPPNGAFERVLYNSAIELRASLKANGLEHGVRIMSVAERGEARRLIRNALKVYALLLAERETPGLTVAAFMTMIEDD